MQGEQSNPEIEAMKNEIKDLTNRIDVLEQSIETKKAELDGDIRVVETSLTNLKWVSGIVLSILIAVFGAILALMARLADLI